MHRIAAFIDGKTPVVVEDELRAARATEVLRAPHLLAESFAAELLGAQLDELDAQRHQSLDPLQVVGDEIEARQHQIVH